uniref:NR LBD domain-containing protein n=1 Tax=Panagrolaimus sp. ES5 TaxID=591445 RepID=A0AC34GNP2_9BILA
MLSKHTTFKLYLLIDIILCIDTARLIPGIRDLDDNDLEIILKHSALISQITAEEYVLAKTIALCNPAIPELSHDAQRIVSTQREYYANILFKHEQESYGIEAGAVKYTKIMSAIEAMYHFAQRQREFHNICRMQFLMGADNPWPNTCKLKLFEDSVI